jgi:ATP-dependent helicase/nuclease subunit B
MWMRDPYALYAKRILRLQALKELDADPGASERGSFIHQALQEFTRRHPCVLPEDPIGELLTIGEHALAPLADRPNVRTFWWPRFEKIAVWFIERERERRHHISRSWAEIKGKAVVFGTEGPFELRAMADRIDLRNDSAVEIIDYKTGIVESNDFVRLGFLPQLPLEAVIAEKGGFPDLPPTRSERLQYWLLKGDSAKNTIRDIQTKKVTLDQLIDEAHAGIESLIAAFDDPSTSYPSQPYSRYAPRHSDYEHLARVKEWSGGGEEDDEG